MAGTSGALTEAHHLQEPGRQVGSFTQVTASGRSAWARAAQGDKEIYLTTDGACTAFQRRPFLKAFLEEVCQLFEVAIFTAGSRVRPLFKAYPERRHPSHLALDMKRQTYCAAPKQTTLPSNLQSSGDSG